MREPAALGQPAALGEPAAVGEPATLAEPAALPAALPRTLLDWYRRERRDLPWRRTGDPYAIWVAEVMLQQTQVEAVLPYYRRFLDRFPTVGALAAADLHDVLKAWEGLGYYGRARRLRQAAGRIAADGFPTTEEDWRRLPGVGPYTAAAVASIAFGRDALTLDGNARRVFARLLAQPEPRDARLRQAIRPLLPPGRAGDFNQAVMDLGSLVCRPRQPRCPACPVRAFCRAQLQGLAEAIPRPRARPPVPHQDLRAAIVRRGRRLLLARRAEEGLLGGLWEFPTRPGRPEGEPLVTVEHAYTHLRTTTRAYPAEEANLSAYETSAWVQPGELGSYPMTKVARRIAEALE